MDSFIKLYRRFLEWGWHDDPNMVSLFIHLLLLANYEDKEWHGITIERGQFVGGRKVLAEMTGISEQTIRTCLSRLESTGEITRKSTNKFSIITITNYGSYQQSLKGDQPTTNQQSTNNQPTTNQQLTTTKEIKKERNKENNITPIIPFEVSPEFSASHLQEIAQPLWQQSRRGDGYCGTINGKQLGRSVRSQG